MPRVRSNAFHEQLKDEVAFVTYSKFAHGGFAEDDNIPGSAHIIYCYPVLLSPLQQRTTRTVPFARGSFKAMIWAATGPFSSQAPRP
jgi:hypothetical protein